MKRLFVLWGMIVATGVYASSGRDMVQRYLGGKAAEFIFGEEEATITLPKIPEVKNKNTDEKTYQQDSQIYRQGEQYDNLAEDKKQVYQYAYLSELVQVVRNAEADEETVAKLFNSLSQGASREGVYRSLVLDNIYARMESVEKVPSDKLIDFSVRFAKKFANKNYDAKSLAQANLFTIKRVLTESYLEVLDELAPNPQEVYSWYAVFSGDMAQEFPNLWRGKIRSKKDVKEHYQWAQQVPFQHIKSEVILKLHSAMNGLDA